MRGPSSTHIHAELTNRFDIYPTQSKKFRYTNPPPGFSNQIVALPFAVRNDYRYHDQVNTRTNLIPQSNMKSTLSEPKLLRNFTSSATTPLGQNAAVKIKNSLSMDSYFGQAFVNEDWLLPRPEFSKINGKPLKLKPLSKILNAMSKPVWEAANNDCFISYNIAKRMFEKNFNTFLIRVSKAIL